MKNTLVLILFLKLTSNLHSQELTDKKGRNILPDSSDWGISVDATNFINFAADLAHPGAPATQTAPTFNPLNSTFSISGRYFKNSSTVYRATTRLFNESSTSIKYIDKLDINTTTSTSPNWPTNLNPEQVKDIQKIRNWAVGVACGFEKRKGKKYRLQGYYGAELGFIFSGNGEKYKYGNDIVVNSTNSSKDDNISDYTTNFGSNITEVTNEYQQRILLNRSGKTIALAARGFVGIEYFFFSKMSLGGEFGWGMGWYRTGRGSKTVEGLDFKDDLGNGIATGSIVNEVKFKNSNNISRGWFIGMDRENGTANEPKELWMNSYSPSGKLSLNFYF